MYKPKMQLTPEQENILNGKEGETKAKMMETIVRLGDMFEAPRLAKVTHKEGHLVSSFGIGLLVAMKIINCVKLENAISGIALTRRIR